MKFYLSHSIRGKYGADATATQMKKNCDKAILIANVLRATFPPIEIYCPAEHEAVVTRAFRHGWFDEKKSLEIDCEIIDTCEGVIIYVPDGDELQGGRLIEYNHTETVGKPVFIFADVRSVISWLTHYLLRA